MKKSKVQIGIGLCLLLVTFFPLVGVLNTQAWGDTTDIVISPVSPDEPEDSPSTDQNSSEGLRSIIQGNKGKVIVINRTSEYVDVYLDGDFVYSALPPNHKLTIKKVQKGWHQLYAEATDGTGSWGPTDFYLKNKYTWTLLP